MGKAVIRRLDPVDDLEAAQALCLRATDYIQLESGAPPAPDYAAKLIAEAPPNLPAEDVFAFAAETGGQLAGIVTCLRNFYQRGEWYMGLLLLDPDARGAGLGARMAAHVFGRAQSEQASCIRVAVLDANPRARAFWEAQGFVHERAVCAKDQEDGHMRHILKLNWEG